MKTTISFCLFIIMISSSCSDEDINYKLNSKSIEYFAHATDSSWWIYIDSDEETRDSFYIAEYHDNQQYLSDKIEGESYQNIRYNLISNDKINVAELSVSWPKGKDSIDIFSYKSSYQGVLSNYFKDFPLILINDNSFSVEDCNTCGIRMIPEISIYDQNFDEVLKVWNSVDTFYFAPFVGLIQYYVDGKYFKLENYHINN